MNLSENQTSFDMNETSGTLNITGSTLDVLLNTTDNDLIKTLANATSGILRMSYAACSKPSWSGAHFYFSESWLNWFDFWVFGIVITCISAFGFAGNVLSIIVLRRCVVETTVTPYLIALAICDNFSILSHVLSGFSISYKSIIDVNTLCGQIVPFLVFYNVFFARTAQTCVGFLTTAITATRFFMISSLAPSKSSRLPTFVSVIIVIIGPLISCSVLFKYIVGSCYDEISDTVIHYRTRSPYLPPSFNKIEGITHSVVTVYLPWLTVAVFNILLICKLCRARTVRQTITTGAQNDHTNRTTSLLLCVTISYMVLYFPTLINININLVKSSTFIYGVCRTPTNMPEVRTHSIFSILKVLNSCINIIFYCLFGSNFRQGLLRLLGYKGKGT